MELYENSPDDFSSFFEQTPDLVCIADKKGFFKNVNTSVVNKLGYSKAEILSRPIVSFIFPEDIKITELTRWEMFQGKPLMNFENRYVTKTGEIVWLHWTSFYMPDKQCVFAIAKDITFKKKLEKEVDEKYQQFKKLALNFKGSIEIDRQKFAVELHEELAQLAAVIKLNLNSVTNSHPELAPSAKEKIEYASYLSELMIQTIRKISFEVSPYTLDYDCLKDALNILCKDFSVLHETPCFLEADFSEENISKEIKIDFFRVCQEALKNVLNHSQAKSVTVTIKEDGKRVSLTIFDNGKGFDPKKQRQKSGLSNIRDRVASINGQLKITSKPGEGTVINVIVDKKFRAVRAAGN
jgi:PAS domain S-box-containing protein